LQSNVFWTFWRWWGKPHTHTHKWRWLDPLLTCVTLPSPE
jgi:hypothetical protein